MSSILGRGSLTGQRLEGFEELRAAHRMNTRLPNYKGVKQSYFGQGRGSRTSLSPLDLNPTGKNSPESRNQQNGFMTRSKQ